MSIHPTFMQRMIEGAKNYALADKSDPFTYRRAMTHTLNGIAGRNSQGDDAYYSAEPYQEERYLPDGRSYTVTAYKNMRRP